LTGNVSFVATRSVGGHLLERAFKLWANAHTAAFDAVVTTVYRLISLAVIIVWAAMFVPSRLYARDDGRFTNSPLKEWFDRLRAEGYAVLHPIGPWRSRMFISRKSLVVDRQLTC